VTALRIAEVIGIGNGEWGMGNGERGGRRQRAEVL